MEHSDNTTEDISYTIPAHTKFNTKTYTSNVWQCRIHYWGDLAVYTLVEDEHNHATAYHWNTLDSKGYVLHIPENKTTYNSKIFLSKNSSDVVEFEDPNHATTTNFHGLNVFDLSTWSEYLKVNAHLPTPVSPTKILNGFEVIQNQSNDSAGVEVSTELSWDLYIPHIPSEDLFWSGLAILNEHDNPIDVEFEFYQVTSKGQRKMEPVLYSMPAKSRLVGTFQELFPTLHSVPSWGIVRVIGKRDQTNNIGGCLMYGYKATGGFCGTSLSPVLSDHFTFPLCPRSDKEWTGIAIINPDPSETARIAFTRWENGEERETVTLEVAPETKFATCLKEIYGNISFDKDTFFTGVSNIPVSVVGVTGDMARSYMFSLAGSGFYQ